MPWKRTGLPTAFEKIAAAVAALVLRRAYLSHTLAAASGRTRILIFGAGAAAQVVGQTIKKADPNAHIVGYIGEITGEELGTPTFPDDRYQQGMIVEIGRAHV